MTHNNGWHAATLAALLLVWGACERTPETEEVLDDMREHTLESETQIATETLRYSTDIPGQAVAYQMGKRRIFELRAKAEAALGERFDVRRFHEAVIGGGALPLAVLEKRIERFIEEEEESST